MNFEPRDLITIVGAAISLTGLYYALKRDVVKVAASLRTIESYHKREIEMMNSKISDLKDEQDKANSKIDKRLDTIQAQNLQIATDLATLTGYIKGSK